MAVAFAAALALSVPVGAFAASGPSNDIVWNGATDKAVAASIVDTPSARTNASGVKITSNAHSAAFPGIYFIWDSKQKDNGYLKVSASVFDTFDSFTLTTKESNVYRDFVISVQAGQQLTSDDCYVFYIPKVVGNKNINMVFISDWQLKVEDTLAYNVSFIVYWIDDTGVVRTTNVDWQTLAKPGECINFDETYAAYDEWVAKGGLPNPGKGWVTGGIAPKTFAAHGPVCYEDLTADQQDGYNAQQGNPGIFYLDPGYELPEVVVSYDRYLGDVRLWNDLYTGPLSDQISAADKALLSAEGGLAHYYALLAAYGADTLPPYYHFDTTYQDIYDSWADQLEVGLNHVLANNPGLGVDLETYWTTTTADTFPQP
ncbi:MAG: hypothetical protein FWD75_07665 [Propionibacteriaceae bacterium]|nr:hypothetical protein [Propionibacteriaceae bacterium]